MQHRLLQVLPNIWETRPEHPFGGAVTKTQAFLIQRKHDDNVWVYASSHVGDYQSHIQELGGVKYQLLNHRDEASKFCNVLQAQVFCHALEKEAIQGKGAVVDTTFDAKEHKFGDDLVAYHTPGHARGVTSYLYRSGDVSVLFSGDTLYTNQDHKFDHGPLQYHAYPGNNDDMIKTLQLFIELNPTYVVPGLTQSEFVNKFEPDQVKELISRLEESR